MDSVPPRRLQDDPDELVFPDGSLPVMTVPLAPERPRPPSRLPKLIYVALLIGPLAIGAAVILVRAGVIAQHAETAKTPWDLSVILLGLITSLVMALYTFRQLPELVAHGKGHGVDQSVAAWEFGVVMVTAPLSVLMSLGAVLAWAGLLPWLPLPADPISPLVLSASAMLVAAGPAAYFGFLRQRQTRAIEARFPDFLRDLNESYGAGMTMAQAIRVAARGDYGMLNPEIRRMAHQVSWGTSFPDALRMFAERVGTPLVVRAVALINKATEAGGSVKDVLEAASRDAREIDSIESERRSGMALYVIVIYVSFTVFLGVVGALQGLLVPSLLTTTSAVQGGSLGGLRVGSKLTLDDFRFIYFGVGLVQALGSGIVAGVMSEGTLRAGLKHAAVLVGISILVLGIAL